MALADLNVSLALVTKNFDKELGKVQRRLNRFSRELTSIGSTLSTSITAPLVALGTVSTRVFSDFEQEMAKVKAISGATDIEFRQLTESALELGRTTQFTASQVAGLQLNLSKLGFSPDEINAATAGILDLALATGEDLAQSATVAAGTLRGFELAATDIGRVTDVMAQSFSSTGLDLEKFEVAMRSVAPVANVAGASLEQTTAVLGALINRNVDASTAGTALRNIFLRLAKEGLTWKEAMDKVRASTNPLATATELFGERGAAVVSIIANNADEIAGLTAAFDDAEGSARDMARIMEDTLQGSFKKLTSAAEGAAISFGSILAPTIRAIADRLNELVTRFNNFNPELKKAIVNIALVAASIGPVVFAIGKFISVASFAISVTRTLATVFSSSVGVLVNVATGFSALRKSVQASIIAFKALDLATKATIIGGVALVVVGLAAAFTKLNNTLSDGARIQRTLNGIQNDAKKSVAEETAAIDPLIAALQDENRTRAEKEGVLKKLQGISPEYFGSLDLEKSKVEDITDAYDKYKISLLETAKFQAAQTRLQELAAKEFDLLEQKAKIAARIQEGGTSGTITRTLLGAGRDDAVIGLVKTNRELEKIAKDRESILNLISEIDLNQATASPVSTGSFSSPDIIGTNLQASVDVDTSKITSAGKETQAAFAGPFAFVQESIQRAASSVRLFGNNVAQVLTPTEKLQRTWEAQKISLDGLDRSALSFNATLGEVKSQSQATVETVAPSIERMNKLGETLTGIGQQLGLSFRENGDAFIDFKELGVDTLGSLVNAFGDSIVGVKNFGQEVGKILKSVLAQILKAVAAAAAFSLIFSIFTGGAGAGFGGTFLGLLKGGIKLPGFAQGGIVPPGFPNDSYPALLSSNEAVIPLSRLNEFGGGGGTLDARISGRDLLLLIDRERAAQSRSRGG